MLQVTRETNTYLADFDALGTETPQPAWLQRLRDAAMARFADLGFPTTRQEDWKYTNVAPIAQTPFRLAAAPGRSLRAPDIHANQPRRSSQDGPAEWQRLLAALTFGEPTWPRLVFVDGHYAPQLSSWGTNTGERSDARLPSGSGPYPPAQLPPGVRAMDLAEALRTEADLAQQHLAQHAQSDSSGFVALNTAFIRHGAFVSIPADESPESPIHLLFISTASTPDTVSHPRVLLIVGSGSTASIVESYVSLGEGVSFTNAVTEIVVGDNATVEHVKLLEENVNAFHVATTQVHQGHDSRFTSHSVAMGAGLGRNDLRVVLAGEGAECTLNGLYVTDGTQHIDNHTAVDHAQPHGASRELYKGILNGRSRAVFNGKVIVRPGAQKTDAYQTNRNLLLSPEATVDTKPQLEIFADDVKCSHGAAIGSLDEQATFYLLSRGLGREAARQMLTYGFATEVTKRIAPQPVRSHVERLLAAKLDADPVGASDD